MLRAALAPALLLATLAALAACAGAITPAAVAPSPAPPPAAPNGGPPDLSWLAVLPIKPRVDLAFEHLSLEDGLSQSVVTDMAQDRRGFLWLGTQDGLNRFDGYQFRIFKHDPDDPTTLSGSFIAGLVPDESGALWVGSDGGLDRYDPASERFTRFQHDPKNPQTLGPGPVTAVVRDPEGLLWVGTPSGLNRFDPASGLVQRYQHDSAEPNSLLDNGVTQLYVDSAGRLWIGTGKGLDQLNLAAGWFTHFVSDPADPETMLTGPVAAIVETRDGSLWVGTDHGLARLDQTSGRFKHYHQDPPDPASLSNELITALLEDRTGQLWVATTLGGLNRYDPAIDGFVHYRHDPARPASLSNDNIASLFEDAAGILWTGTFGSGVDRYDPQKAKFLRFSHDPADPASLSDNIVWTLLVDRRGTLWVGTAAGGLNRADPGSTGFRRYQNDANDPSSLSSNQVFRVYEDRAGTLWVGTQAGLDRLDRESGRFTRYAVGGGAVFAIAEAGDGVLWLGTTAGGLRRFDPATGDVVIYEPDSDDPTSISGFFVSSILADGEGGYWVGTFSGVNRFDPASGRFVRYEHRAGDATSLPHNTVLALSRDSLGRLWLATSGGLALLESDVPPGTFVSWGEREGLPNELVYGILEDDRGTLWLPTNRGLAHFDPAAGTFENYDLSDGLQSMEFNQGAVFAGPGGELYAGGIKGFNVFHPEAVGRNLYAAPVVITEFLLFNEPVAPGQGSPLGQTVAETREIRLGYQDDFLAFEYAALDYSSPDDIEYAYILEGFDQEWNEAGRRRFASYTGLPPGGYTFRVKATNSNGVWNETGAALQIVIAPPFWQTWWFTGLAVTLGTGTVLGGFWLRLRMLQAQRRRLEVQVAERTRELEQTLAELRQAQAAAEAASRAKSAFLASVSHELRTPLNAIIGFSQLVIRSAQTGRGGQLSAEQRENLEVIQRSGEHLLGLINDVLEMSKIEAGRSRLSEEPFDLHGLLAALDSMFGLRSREKGLALRSEVEPGLPQFVRGDEGKLRQILMNLLGNAVKFTRQGHVALHAAAVRPPGPAAPGEPLRLRIAVEDTGPGIAPEEREQIFVPFLQSSAGIASQEGTGLGLAISRQFARLLGGDLTVTSEVGRGSTFVLEIPIVPAGEASVPAAGPARLVVGLAPGQPVYRLLAADDSEVNRKLLVRLFEPLGFELREAANGREVVELAASWAPHLIWMDMRMPLMDGYEATRRIKATAQGQATVIVALTATALEEDRRVILSDGCDDYVRKPFREEELFEVLARHLGVRFLYAEEPAPAPARLAADDPAGRAQLASSLAAQPADWRAALREACVLGDQERLLALLGELHDRDPELARALMPYAERYDHQAILSLVQPREEPREGVREEVL